MGDMAASPGAEELLNQNGSNTAGGTVVPDQLASSSSKPGLNNQFNPHTQFHHQYAADQFAYNHQTQNLGIMNSGPYNMAAMNSSLPRVNSFRSGGYPPPIQQQQLFSPTTSSPPMMSHMSPQYSAPNSMPMAGQPYYVPHPPHPQAYYGNHVSPPHQQFRGNVGYYPSQSPHGQQQPGYMPPGYYYPQGNPGFSSAQAVVPQAMISATLYGNAVDPRVASHSSLGESVRVPGPRENVSSESSNSNVVRGPPRKPRQSGHAIWIGNLPPQTDLMSLVHHVCQEASGLESLFLISKSNCAFANFEDEQICLTAQQKLHDSKFHSVRLVSRLRKSTVEGAAGMTAPTGPAASSVAQISQDLATEVGEQTSEVSTTSDTPTQRTSDADGNNQKDKFFILKSLTVEDLELSVRTGIWATQSHNEEGLNGAFESSDNVYLVFSANKSGEYFGYARMVSPINQESEAAIEFAPKSQGLGDVDLPKAIPTKATEFAPKGRIIDDSARGTIFWEAEKEEVEGLQEEDGSFTSGKAEHEQPDGTTKTWGRPFKLEWLSTSRLPFYRTRGLRNPWNSNREVKIARDGTELESSVGRKLIGLFNRMQSPALVPAAMRPGTMMHGYPPMRPPYQ